MRDYIASLRLLLTHNPKRIFPALAEPLQALRDISRDPQFRWEISLHGNRSTSAIAVQRDYLRAVRELCDLDSSERKHLVADWETVLDDLETDFMRCRNRLDWPAKFALIREFQCQQNLGEDDPWLQSLDLEYHRLDRVEGLYYGLEEAGAMLGVPDANAVREAISEPPKTTRAYVRGKCIQKFSSAIISAQWDHVTLQGEKGPIRISLLDLFSPEQIARVAALIDAAQTPDDLNFLDASFLRD